VKDASDYLDHIRALILLENMVLHWQVVREEAQVQVGMLRHRLTLQNQQLLEIFERFIVVQNQVSVTRYSYHWQDEQGKLIKRWDNAPHHPTLPTHPHHLHEGSEEQILPNEQVTLLDVFAVIQQTFSRTERL